MPELPEIAVYAENLSRRFAAHTIKSAITLGRARHLHAIADTLPGRVLSEVTRNGKELVFQFDDGTSLWVHLMLAGFARVGADQAPPCGTVLSVVFDTGEALYMGDQSGKIRVRRNPPVPSAPDALDPRFTLAYFHRKCSSHPSVCIKAFLMDQRIVRGIGNAYADEILWYSRISPFSQCGKLDDPSVGRLHRAIKTVLQDAIEQIRRNRPDMIDGEYREFLAVHHPGKERSPTGARIQHGEIDGRRTYFTEEQVLYGESPEVESDEPDLHPVLRRRRKRKNAPPAELPSGFHPLIAEWFGAYVGEPTDVQMKAWPEIASGKNVLVTAPTGSGKTLTAFLWAINQLVTGAWEPGRMRVLYISPLKALNNDVRENLIEPLAELRDVFGENKVSFPEIRVLTRSGDTSSTERRKMLRHPPEILITTPESLNLLLTSGHASQMCPGLTTVILDEIHAVVGGKRGTYLITGIERLVRRSGEFQRIALSATVRPLEEVAAFVGGYRRDLSGSVETFRPRAVSIIHSSYEKKYDLTVRFPPEALEREDDQSLWDVLAPVLKKTVVGNRSTLIFTNNRALCEKLALRINEGERTPLAYAHHGSLSREIRFEVERKLRDGQLKAIVATHSLELGIDIGNLDEVILIQSPFTISSAVQRIGRAGHKVGETSRAQLYPSHAHDFVEAAVLVQRLYRKEIEEVHPVKGPLDVLAQVIVSMTVTEMWDIDDLYNCIRTAYPFRTLQREQFDLVLGMLAGKYRESRIRELNPRISVDKESNTVVARKGARLACMLSGGVIPDRGYYHMRHHKSNARIGELDEEFVWEARVGKTFSLGTQKWRIEKITHNDVLVSPAPKGQMAVPFWKGEQFGRDWYYSEHIARFLQEVDGLLRSKELPGLLLRDHGMDKLAAERLITYCKAQREVTGCPLPHRYNLVFEHVATGPGGVPGHHIVVHTIWGGMVNRPFALALQAAWFERFGNTLEIFPTNDSIALLVPEEITADELFQMVTPKDVERLLRLSLERSGYFGSRFRECASRALLLTRKSASRRMPLWMTRLRAQKLLGAVARYDDFPILLETWRSCLQDEFDLPTLRMLLSELESGEIGISEVRTTAPSPMAQDISWNQINTYMYATDEPAGHLRSQLREDLLAQVALTPDLRPVIPAHVVERFTQKRQRLFPGYAPTEIRDLIDWVDERLCIPWDEWNLLVDSVTRDGGPDAQVIANEVKSRLVCVTIPTTKCKLVFAKDQVVRVAAGMGWSISDYRVTSLQGTDLSLAGGSRLRDTPNAGDLLEQWLRYYGPVKRQWCRDILGISEEILDEALEDLIDSEKVVAGRLVDDGHEDELCDAENFETLLRLTRADAAPSPEPLPIEQLQPFWATFSGLSDRVDSEEGFRDVLERLLCYPAPAHLWEAEFFPARVTTYNPTWLDRILQEGHLRWIGVGLRKVMFCFPEDFDLVVQEAQGIGRQKADSEPSTKEPEQTGAVKSQRLLDVLFPDDIARYDFTALLNRASVPSHDLSNRLWKWTWETRLSNDSFTAVRKGIQTKFGEVSEKSSSPYGELPSRTRRHGRGSFGRWKAGAPFAGSWYRLDLPKLSDDVLQREERSKERVRMVVDRYGIVFREVLQRELPSFQWAQLFRSLRIMEFSGEVVSGYFFEGIPGPQFASRAAVSMVMHWHRRDRIFWLNATDPVSVSGLGLESLKGKAPSRVESTHCVYRGGALVLVSRRNGKELTFGTPPDDQDLEFIVAPLKHLLTRREQRLTRIQVEKINGVSAEESPYLPALKQNFDLSVEYKGISLLSPHA